MTKVCAESGCVHGGKPQPEESFCKSFGGRHWRCRECRAAWRKSNQRVPQRARRKALPRGCNERLGENLRGHLRRLIRNGATKTASASKLLGCSIDEFRQHIESLWQPGMTWQNWTTDGWHMDHKKPISAFDLSDPSEIAAACHFTNIQPMWAAENISKGDRY